MAATYTVTGHRPFRFGEYEALPGTVLHEGWLKGLESEIPRLIRLGMLAVGAKTKDAPAEPPAELKRVLPGEPTPVVVETPTPDVEPVAEPAAVEVLAGDPNDTESHVADAPADLPVTGE